MPENEFESKGLKLACPHCGGKLLVEMETQGSGHLTHDSPSGFICSTLNCGAEWDIEGEVVQDPNWVLWPTIYTKPVNKEDR